MAFTLPALADQVAALEQRIADLEAAAADNAERITALSVSDEASGWKKWREDKEADGLIVSGR